VPKFGFWAAGNDGSSNYRALLPARAISWLRPKEHNPYGRPHAVGASRNLADIHQADVIIGSRVAHPGAMPGWRQLKEDGKRLVLDLDDDYFHIDKENRTAYQWWVNGIQDGKPIQEGGFLPFLRESIELADVVTVCSEGLAENIYKETLHPNIKVVENALGADVLGLDRDYDPELLTVGWAGTENTAQWLPMIKDVINKAAKDGYGRRVFIQFIGAPASFVTAHGFRLRRGHAKAYEFLHRPEDYLRELSRIDVLLAPYRSTLFTEAKFPTKALEAGFLGIPLIASAIRPYREWIDHGVNGFLVRNNAQHEWGRYLGALIQDAALRRSMGMEARERASDNTLQDYLGVAWEEACLS